MHIWKVMLSITTRCNRRCPSCSYGVGSVWPRRDMPMPLLEEASRYFRHLPAMTITGGEPSVHPQFDEISASMHAWFPEAEMLIETNGYGFRRCPQAFAHYDRIYVTRYTADTYPGCPPNGEEIETLLFEHPEIARRIVFTTPVHRSKGGGSPCAAYRSGVVACFNGRLYPCCSAQGVPGAESIPLSDDWEARIASVEPPCAHCALSLP